MDLAEAINAFVRWLVQNYGETFEAISQGLLSFLLFFEGLLRGLSWFWQAGLVLLAGWWLSRRLVFALGVWGWGCG